MEKIEYIVVEKDGDLESHQRLLDEYLAKGCELVTAVPIEKYGASPATPLIWYYFRRRIEKL